MTHKENARQFVATHPAPAPTRHAAGVMVFADGSIWQQQGDGWRLLAWANGQLDAARANLMQQQSRRAVA